MLELRSLALERNGIAARCCELGLSTRDVKLADFAEVEAPLQQTSTIFAQAQSVAQQRELFVGLAQREIGLRHIGLQRELH